MCLSQCQWRDYEYQSTKLIMPPMALTVCFFLPVFPFNRIYKTLVTGTKFRVSSTTCLCFSKSKCLVDLMQHSAPKNYLGLII